MSEQQSRRKWSSAEKLRIVMAGLDRGTNLSELCRQEGINVGQYYQWKKQLLDSAEQVFSDGRVIEKKDQEELLAKLYQQIGQMKVELDWLQKKLWSN